MVDRQAWRKRGCPDCSSRFCSACNQSKFASSIFPSWLVGTTASCPRMTKTCFSAGQVRERRIDPFDGRLLGPDSAWIVMSDSTPAKSMRSQTVSNYITFMRDSGGFFLQRDVLYAIDGMPRTATGFLCVSLIQMVWKIPVPREVPFMLPRCMERTRQDASS